MILPTERKPAALLHPMWSAGYSIWFVAKLLQAPNKLQFAVINVFLKCELISPFWADSKALQDGSEIRVGSFQTMGSWSWKDGSLLAFFVNYKNMRRATPVKESY